MRLKLRRLVCLMILAVAFGLLTIHLMFTPDVSLDVATTAHHSNQEIGFNWSELVEAERQGGQEEEEEAGDGAQEQREALLMEDEGRLGREGASEQQHSCEGPYDQAYPNCANKLEWMSVNWESDPCYKELGVDGTTCSFLRYLSEVEQWCPLLPGRSKRGAVEHSQAERRVEVKPLLDAMASYPKLDWLRRRISTHWSHWGTAVVDLPFHHHSKNILLHIGALSDKSGFKLSETADHGGPLGELVQWSDLIASLYALGHKLQFSIEVDQLGKQLVVTTGIGGCPTSSETKFDVVYTDIVGLKQFSKATRSRLQHYACLFRVLDTFGTEPQFNYRAWKPAKPPGTRQFDYGKTWGNWDLHPRQFMTLYPHTPDNSFLGFAVTRGKERVAGEEVKRQGVVYGKELYMWEGKREYLDVISRHLDVHATLGTTIQKHKVEYNEVVPGFVQNHGILSSDDLQLLLSQSKLMIGLGFPYEGPAPLEAIANGCYFLNPTISPPISSLNSKFFKSKPTLRSLNSQNPYVESFVGRPHVYTIDMNNLEEVEEVIKEISGLPPATPYLPIEFSHLGMLERLSVYVEHQDFCSPHQWPPLDELVAMHSRAGESCKDACYREAMVCEPEFFPALNSEEALKKHNLNCQQTTAEHSVHGPSISSSWQTCSVQQTHLLLSCVGSADNTVRLCPCRTYDRGQIALCSSCRLL